MNSKIFVSRRSRAAGRATGTRSARVTGAAQLNYERCSFFFRVTSYPPVWFVGLGTSGSVSNWPSRNRRSKQAASVVGGAENLHSNPSVSAGKRPRSRRRPRAREQLWAALASAVRFWAAGRVSSARRVRAGAGGGTERPQHFTCSEKLLRNPRRRLGRRGKRRGPARGRWWSRVAADYCHRVRTCWRSIHDTGEAGDAGTVPGAGIAAVWAVTARQAALCPGFLYERDRL